MTERAHRAKTKEKKHRTPSRRRSRKLDIGTGVQTSYFFMLNCLLHSRVSIGIESNSVFYDEDVNVYLAHLLNAHIDPRYLQRVSRYIAYTDTGLAASLDGDPDCRRKYETYKANADFLLMAVSVFDLYDEPRHSRPFALRTPKRVYVARASMYYSLAASYACKLERGQSSVAGTLSKLAEGIEDYVRILSYMRGEYLDFIRRYSPGELFHLDRAIEEIERDLTIEQMRDEFLDTYHAWMKTGADDLKARLEEQAGVLREIDPTFDFKLPS
ncbi:MAG: hypothetical protein JXB46_07255 [Candidatus Eisenbacteria bacterium]|nr:hypothetical protein [Candidatus Eisenbacteria bacterium]